MAAPDRSEPLDAYRADLGYLGADHLRNERRTWIVAAICAATLAVQITGGLVFHSMALTASGLHMAAHVAAMAVAAGAYGLARRYAGDPRFAFGTGKLGYLAGFANAVVLAATAVAIAVESVQRLIAPEPVDFGAALPLAVAGLAVTLVCMALLKPQKDVHGPDEAGDLNIAAAHLHLTADAVVGLLTIAGLAAGKRLGWTWADPATGLVGAALVAQFAGSLIARAAAPLLDMTPSPELAAEVRERLEADGGRVIDLHLWRLGPGHFALAATVAAPGQTAARLKRRLSGLAGIRHATIELRGADEAGHGSA